MFMFMFDTSGIDRPCIIINYIRFVLIVGPHSPALSPPSNSYRNPSI